MVFLLKCLVTVLQNPQPLSPSKYVQNLHSNSASPKFSIQSHRVHLDLATAKTLTNRIHRYGSQSHRHGLANSLWLLAITLVPPSLANRSHRDGLPTLCCLIVSLRSYRVDAIGATGMRFALAIALWSIRVVPVGPTEIPNVHIFYTVRCHRDFWSVPPSWVKSV